MIQHATVQHANNGKPIGICIFLALAGFHLLFSSLKKWQRARLVQDTPIAPIKSAPQGFVEFEGHAWPNLKPLIAPVSERPSVFYSLLVEHYVRNGNNSSWVKVYDDATKEPFYILDATGIAMVSPDPGECTVQLRTQEISLLTENQKSRVFGLMGKSLPTWFSGGRYRVTEGVILAGGPVYALGTFRTWADVNKYKITPGAAEFLKRISKTDRPASLLEMGKINYVHNGAIDKEEQSAYFNKLALEIIGSASNVNFGVSTAMGGARVSGDPSYSSQSETSAEEPRCAGMMMSTEERKIYFADCHKAELENRLRKWFLARVIGGAVMIAVGATGALFLFGLQFGFKHL